MGKQIRRVPPNWEHPKDSEGRYIPIYDRNYTEALNEWLENHKLWENGEHPYQKDPSIKARYKFFAQWEGNPPRVSSYLPDIPEDRKTWFQVYETVSEGTPITPPFATEEELIDYLCERGTTSDERRYPGESSWDRKDAEDFVKISKSMPSMIISVD